uniref:Hint domain-containing protein n=1 Tax=Rhodosorus marinus TaxID=101924 RepID=A0A7S3A3G3_9RHOD|mmetsp:Transcript_41052/g.162314  ORF Transcript_41052/g.162314 Transcript_41052/m.162314 type:complete len:339 (+) Transcript_41052:204-1220(+)|eukprot:CAMPEP_0113963834 /NCGR_PEP_ID=MMETSP0011_2-20120614/6759_1 /TAXON_ID=101924 /ORGANISM="Rhodosorus marinus" /LENGTH=338 /DNA_ID=CAMNT_0000975979 /DNA_START=110 /DNA_END=1126 /DNA_ORIENTATION=- /assembly_acc=CAM_ASM_000156
MLTRWVFRLVVLFVILELCFGVLQYRDVYNTFQLGLCESPNGEGCPEQITIPPPTGEVANGGDVFADINMLEVTGLNCTQETSNLTIFFQPGESSTTVFGECDTVLDFQIEQFQNSSSRDIQMVVNFTLPGSTDGPVLSTYAAQPICFGGSSRVRILQDGQEKTVRVDQVKVGDRVESVQDGKRVFSDVFLVQHDRDEALHEMLEIKYSASDRKYRTLRVTHAHLLYMSDCNRKRAGDLVVGDSLLTVADPEHSLQAVKIVAVERVVDVVRNLHTLNDRIVVEGIVASAMTDYRLGPLQLQYPILLLPFKVLHSLGLGNIVRGLDRALRDVFGRYISP